MPGPTPTATATVREGDGLRLRALTATREDRAAVAELIYVSTNAWYQASGRAPIFAGGPAVTELFADVYEALDPGCCVLAESARTGRLMGSCFYHPRETHVSLGIMNVHPAYFGRGVARRLLRHITDFADARGQPVRLVSSALNLDSFSLYTRAGFVPRCAYQDILLAVPPGGLGETVPGLERVRPATAEDVDAIVALEREISGIARAGDYRHFLANEAGIWRLSVLPGPDGALEGVLASVAHPGSTMLGPGVARTAAGAAALLLYELDGHRGRSPVFLVPVECRELVRLVYAWGGRNCEVHFAQVRGAFQPFRGVTLPTFMPETG
jgi:GNAT superfamily N-acetyltransferase